MQCLSDTSQKTQHWQVVACYVLCKWHWKSAWFKAALKCLTWRNRRNWWEVERWSGMVRWSLINPMNSEFKLQKWSRADHNQGEAQMMSTPGDSRSCVCSYSPLLKRQGILLCVCAMAIRKSSSIYQPWLFLSSMCVKESFWTCVKMQIKEVSLSQ